MTPKEALKTPKEKVLKELQEFHECFYDEGKANTAELKRKRIEEYIEKSHKVLYEMHEEKLVLFDELEELKSWRDELNETIQDLISKTKYWEEKENKTDFEKGIARGYKTMLHQLLVGIDFDKEELK